MAQANWWLRVCVTLSGQGILRGGARGREEEGQGYEGVSVGEDTAQRESRTKRNGRGACLLLPGY